jgi:Flp pilus assembly protein TadG
MSRRFAGNVDGATAVEFALLAPVFFMMLFGIIEVGRLIWVKQALTETAYSAARCAALASSCKTQSDIQGFATAHGLRRGLRVNAGLVSYISNTTCDGNAGAVQVTIRYDFASPLSGFIAALPASVEAHGCFPKLS